MGTEGFSEEMAAADSLQLGGLTMSGDIAMGTSKITGMGDGSAAQDAVTKGQLDSAVISGGTVKEALFSEDQLDDTDGINALEAMYFANQPSIGDTVVFKNGTLTLTMTFVANIGAESLETDVSIETSADTALARLVLRTNAATANTQWDLFYETGTHADINDPIVDVVEKASAAGDSDSRIYGVWSTQADCQVVEFAAGGTVDLDYTARTPVNLPSSDPAEGRFGLRRRVVDLTDGEIHLTLDSDNQWSWDNDGTTWQQLSGPGSIPDATSGAGGAVKGKVTFDSDKGLSVTTGIAEVVLSASGALEFSSGEIAVNLEASNPSLQISTNELGVKIDANAGLQKGASGLGVKIDDTPDTLDVDSDGLKVVGVPSQFKINGSAVSANVTQSNVDTLVAGASSDAQSLHTHDDKSEVGHTHTHASTTGQTANDHHNQVHAIDGADHSLAGATPGDVLTVLTATTFAFSSPGAASKAPKVEADYVASGAISNGDPVYISASDSKVSEALANDDAKARVIGVARGAISDTASGPITSHGPCTAVLGGGGSAGTAYYLQAAGGMGTALPGAGNRVIQVGIAMNTNDLFVRIVDYGKKAA
jgi:hypothetical protein